MELPEFLSRARMEAQVLHAWLEAGWLVPRRDGSTPRFSEIDLARANLIRNLKRDLGVNDEGIPVILDLVDQLHGLRRVLRELLCAIDAQPEPERGRMIGEMRKTAKAAKNGGGH